MTYPKAIENFTIVSTVKFASPRRTFVMYALLTPISFARSVFCDIFFDHHVVNADGKRMSHFRGPVGGILLGFLVELFVGLHDFFPFR